MNDRHAICKVHSKHALWINNGPMFGIPIMHCQLTIIIISRKIQISNKHFDWPIDCYPPSKTTCLFIYSGIACALLENYGYRGLLYIHNVYSLHIQYTLYWSQWLKPFVIDLQVKRGFGKTFAQIT